jgi:hypothetical protein
MVHSDPVGKDSSLFAPFSEPARVLLTALAVFLRGQIFLLATPNLGLHGKSWLR